MIWRAIPGWEGFYEVSDTGLVRSMPRLVPNQRYGSHPIAGRVLKQVLCNGYATVNLSRDGRARRFLVHRLVLLAFRGAPEGERRYGCHSDGNPLNNALSNLRWDTPSANNYDSVAHGTHGRSSRAECAHGHRLTEDNTYLYRGARCCRTCRRESVARYQARRRSVASR